jgi:hypothetical protein
MISDPDAEKNLLIPNFIGWDVILTVWNKHFCCDAGVAKVNAKRRPVDASTLFIGKYSKGKKWRQK